MPADPADLSLASMSNARPGAPYSLADARTNVERRKRGREAVSCAECRRSHSLYQIAPLSAAHDDLSLDLQAQSEM